MRRALLLVALTALANGQAFAGTTFSNKERKTFTAKTQVKRGLKAFNLIREDYKVSFSGGASFGTRMVAEFRTHRLDELQNYGIVQFIRGCQFYSDDRGELSGGIGVQHFDQQMPFHFPEFVIDSLDTDPLYASYYLEGRELPRLAAYRWKYGRDLFGKKGENYVVNKAPKVRQLYVTDRPGTAFYQDGQAKNISLEFKTCVYKLDEIPVVSDDRDFDFSTPIACHTWNSSFIYNHETKKFSSPKEIHPYCLK